MPPTAVYNQKGSGHLLVIKVQLCNVRKRRPSSIAAKKLQFFLKIGTFVVIFFNYETNLCGTYPIVIEDYQGDQTGRIFANWFTVFFGQV
jgi:hypothetical protein